MSTSAGLSGLPGKPGVSGTTSDAPEEATQRPPFLALRGPSHSHPGALLHSRRRITPHHDPRQNPEVSHPGGARRGAGALPVSKVGDVTLPIGRIGVGRVRHGRVSVGLHPLEDVEAPLFFVQPSRTSPRPRGTRGPAPTGGRRGARSWQHTRTSSRPRGTRGPAPTGGRRGARS